VPRRRRGGEKPKAMRPPCATGAPSTYDAADHLVLDLHQVACVEEFGLSKELIEDTLGAWD